MAGGAAPQAAQALAGATKGAGHKRGQEVSWDAALVLQALAGTAPQAAMRGSADLPLTGNLTGDTAEQSGVRRPALGRRCTAMALQLTRLAAMAAGTTAAVTLMQILHASTSMRAAGRTLGRAGQLGGPLAPGSTRAAPWAALSAWSPSAQGPMQRSMCSSSQRSRAWAGSLCETPRPRKLCKGAAMLQHSQIQLRWGALPC